MLNRLFAISLAILCSIGAYAEIPDVNDFRIVPQFPQPATGAFGVVGTATTSGKFVLWDGETVYLQASAGSDKLTAIATGYLGDPGFVTIAPDGRTLMMGAGFQTVMYLLDLRAPVDFVEGEEITVPEHFSGAFLSSNLIILDRSTHDFLASELVVLDLDVITAPAVRTRTQPLFHSVLEFPRVDPATRDVIVDKPDSSYSAKLFVSRDRTLLYAMDANTRELRVFFVTDFIDAFENMTTLDWATDGTLIGLPGDFFSEGVAGENPDEELIIGGSEGFGAPGGVMYVDPEDPALILATLDPAGTEPFYNAIYNRATDELIAIDSTFGQPLEAYARESAIAPVPPRNPCADFNDNFTQWDTFTTENGLNPDTADIDDDGIPEKAILALIQRVSCGFGSKLRSATLVAYDLNLDALDAESDTAELSDYRELLAALMIISEDMHAALPLLLNESMLSLDNDYVRVTCSAGECQPEFEEKQIAALQVGLRTEDEPYSASGDLDFDGTSNLTEYRNVIANGGSNSDFVLAATSSSLDGSSTLERHSSSSGCFIATAAYGTPLAGEIDELRDFRDTWLLSTPLGSAFVGTYYRLSPPVADQVAQHAGLRRFVQVALIPIVFIVKMVNTSLGFTASAVTLLLLCFIARYRNSRSPHRIRS